MLLDLTSLERRLTTAFIGRHILYLARVTSTQDVARQEAEGGAPEGTLVLAEEQSAGRGRLGRSWLSPAGTNLYLTLVLRPPIERLRSLFMVTSLAAAQGVEEATGLTASIKWPNDLLVAGRKLAGVLVDTEFAGDRPRFALVGLGLNVNLDVESIPEVAAIATSLRRELGDPVSREAVLAAVLNRFEALYLESGRSSAVRAAWRARLETLGRQVRVTVGDQREEGLAEDVDAQGSLILRRADGSTVSLAAGDVTLRE